MQFVLAMAPFYHCSFYRRCFASECGVNIHIAQKHDTGYQDLALESDIPDGNYIDFLDTLAEDPIEPNEDNMETVYVNNGNEVIDDSINHSCRKQSISNISLNENKNVNGKQSKKLLHAPNDATKISVASVLLENDRDDYSYAPANDFEDEIEFQLFPKNGKEELEEENVELNAAELEFANVVNNDRKGFNNYDDNFFGFVT